MRLVLLLLAGVVATGVAAHAQFRAGTEAVRVDVLVLDGRKPVSGLAASNFEVRDAGVVQRIDAASYEDEPLRVMLALDTSTSVDGEPLAQLRKAAAAVVDMLRPADRASVLAFNSEVDVACPWTGDHDRLAHALDAHRGAGATALHDAAFAALLERDVEPGRALVVVFTDGDDTASWLPGESVLDAARRTDAVVYTVGLRRRGPPNVGFRFDVSSGVQASGPDSTAAWQVERLLTALARETGGAYLEAESTDRLSEVFTRVLQEFRTRYVLTYTPQGVARNGWHPIEVSLKGAKGKVTARRGYLR